MPPKNINVENGIPSSSGDIIKSIEAVNKIQQQISEIRPLLVRILTYLTMLNNNKSATDQFRIFAKMVKTSCSDLESFTKDVESMSKVYDFANTRLTSKISIKDGLSREDSDILQRYMDSHLVWKSKIDEMYELIRVPVNYNFLSALNDDEFFQEETTVKTEEGVDDNIKKENSNKRSSSTDNTDRLTKSRKNSLNSDVSSNINNISAINIGSASDNSNNTNTSKVIENTNSSTSENDADIKSESIINGKNDNKVYNKAVSTIEINNNGINDTKNDINTDITNETTDDKHKNNNNNGTNRDDKNESNNESKAEVKEEGKDKKDNNTDNNNIESNYIKANTSNITENKSTDANTIINEITYNNNSNDTNNANVETKTEGKSNIIDVDEDVNGDINTNSNASIATNPNTNTNDKTSIDNTAGDNNTKENDGKKNKNNNTNNIHDQSLPIYNADMFTNIDDINSNNDTFNLTKIDDKTKSNSNENNDRSSSMKGINFDPHGQFNGESIQTKLENNTTELFISKSNIDLNPNINNISNNYALANGHLNTDDPDATLDESALNEIEKDKDDQNKNLVHLDSIESSQFDLIHTDLDNMDFDGMDNFLLPNDLNSYDPGARSNDNNNLNSLSSNNCGNS